MLYQFCVRVRKHMQTIGYRIGVNKSSPSSPSIMILLIAIPPHGIASGCYKILHREVRTRETSDAIPGASSSFFYRTHVRGIRRVQIIFYNILCTLPDSTA